MPNIEDAWQNQGDSGEPILASVLRRRAKGSELSLRLQYWLGLVLMAGAIWAFLFHYIHTRDRWLANGTLLAVIGAVVFLAVAPWLHPLGTAPTLRRALYLLGLVALIGGGWAFLLNLIYTFHFWMGFAGLMAGIGVLALLIAMPWSDGPGGLSADLGLTTSAQFYRRQLRNRGTWLSRYVRTAILSMAPGYLLMAGASIGVSRGEVSWLHLAPFLALLIAGTVAWILIRLHERQFVRQEIELVDVILGPADTPNQ